MAKPSGQQKGYYAKGLMREYVTDALVLGLEPRGEADCVADLYTKEFGRLRARVHGGRKILSKFSPHLQSPNLVVLRLVKKRNYTVADALVKELFLRNTGVLAARKGAFELLRLLRILTPLNVLDLNLWFSLVRALRSGRIEIDFFLKLLGHDPQGVKCALCGGARPSYFETKGQIFLCSKCGMQFPEDGLVCIKDFV